MDREIRKEVSGNWQFKTSVHGETRESYYRSEANEIEALAFTNSRKTNQNAE